MGSSGKRKTTMAKLTRERSLRERRLDKQAKKDARKQASAHPQGQHRDAPTGDLGESSEPDAGHLDPVPVVHRPSNG
jgi:hypothetical protein